MKKYNQAIDKLIWIEKRFGITKTIGEVPSTEKMDAVEAELLAILGKYRDKLKITHQVPKVRIWATNDRLNFLFFSRTTGKRIFLGEWLSNKEIPHE